MMPSHPDQDSVDAAVAASSSAGDPDLRAADLRARSRDGSEQREEPPGARSLIVELRERLAATERSLDAERLTSRQARMRAEALSAELERRLVSEDELRAGIRSLTALLTTTQQRLEEAAEAPDAGDLAALRDERDRARAALSLIRDDLRAVQGELEQTRVTAAATARELEGARSDAGAARSELDATARELEDARGELEQMRVALPPASTTAGEHDSGGSSTVEMLRARLEGLVAAPPATGVDGPDLVAGLAAAASRLRERPPTRGRLEPRAPIRPGRWMPAALSRLVATDSALGERVLLGLLPAQSLSVRRPLTYLLEVEDGGAHRVALMAQGAAVGPATDAAADARVRGSLSALVSFAAGGLPARGHGLSLRRGRRLRPLLRARRAPLQLTDLAALLRAPDPELLLLLVCAAVAPQAIDRSLCVDVVVDEDAEPLRIVAAPGSAMRLVRPGDDAPVPDATLRCSAAALPEILAGGRGAAVDGDLGAVLALLGWFDRAQERG